MTEFKQVTYDEFYAFMMDKTQNVHPRSTPNETLWEVVGSREVLGRSTPGYKTDGPKTWHLSYVYIDRKKRSDKKDSRR